MTKRNCLSIVLAAGLGTRMRSDLPKVMHPIGNLPLIGHVLKALGNAASDRVAVVIGPQMEDLEKLVKILAPDAGCHVQADRLGTAHAALAARSAMDTPADDVLVLCGDTPLITPASLDTVRNALAEGADVAVLGFEATDPFGYGRLLVKNGKLQAIREEKDATEKER